MEASDVRENRKILSASGTARGAGPKPACKRQPPRRRPAGPSPPAAHLPLVIRSGAALPLGNLRSSRRRPTAGGRSVHSGAFTQLSSDCRTTRRTRSGQATRSARDRTQSVADTSLGSSNRWWGTAANLAIANHSQVRLARFQRLGQGNHAAVLLKEPARDHFGDSICGEAAANQMMKETTLALKNLAR